jgi:acyl-CoA thioesterase FadM
VHFGYRLTLEPGDRQHFEGREPLELLRAESRHGCISLADGRAARMPDPVYEALSAAIPKEP